MQQYITFLSTVLATASMAVANTIPVNTALARQVGAVPDAPLPTAVIRRDAKDDAKQQACAASVLIELMPPLPENQVISDWSYQEGKIDECTVTAPASVASDINSYLSVLTQWYETVDDKAAKQTDCGMSNFTIPLTPLCSTSRTVFFTDGAEVATSSVYAPFSGPTNGLLVVGAAPRNTGMIGSGMALAAVIAAALVF